MPWIRALLASLLALLAIVGPSRAGSITEIPGATEGQRPLPAYVARPTGDGPYPAVVVLHGCGGFNNVVATWTDRLAGWGYVAVAADSLTPRGRTNVCATGSREQPFDAHQVANFLAAQPFVRADRIGVLGISEGGGSVLTLLERGLIGTMFPVKLRTGVAFYPRCAGKPGVMSVPTLVLIGELDDWTPAEACRDMAAGRTGRFGPPREPADDRSTVELVVYPDAYHSFLASELRGGVRMYNHWLEYNEAAARDASERVRAFLARTLGD